MFRANVIQGTKLNTAHAASAFGAHFRVEAPKIPSPRTIGQLIRQDCSTFGIWNRAQLKYF